MEMFSDTETSGMWDFKASSSALHQPYLMQLSAIAGSGPDSVTVYDWIIKPHGYDKVEPGAQAIHGISYERAMDEGAPVAGVLEEFNDIALKVAGEGGKYLVFHNSNFDTKVLRATYTRARVEPKALITLESKCTMLGLTNVICLPGPRGNKWPKLMEAYRFYFGRDFEGAHNSKFDTEACMRVWYAAKAAGHL